MAFRTFRTYHRRTYGHTFHSAGINLAEHHNENTNRISLVLVPRNFYIQLVPGCYSDCKKKNRLGFADYSYDMSYRVSALAA